MNNPRSQLGNESPPDGELHFSFVELLFSLAIAEIAIRFANIIDVAKHKWAASTYLPCYFHLILALFVITTSWIGWGKSNSSHRKTVFSSVFKLDFAELLIDVFLVIVYFVLVHQSEDPKNLVPSMGPEALCIVFIFILYFLWDVVSKWPWRRNEKNEQIGWTAVKNRIWVSLLSMMFSIVATSYCWWICDLRNQPTAADVALFDTSMIGLVIVFRELKEVATTAPANWLGWWRLFVAGSMFLFPLIAIRFI